MKSYVDSFLKPSYVPVSINKFYLVPEWIVAEIWIRVSPRPLQLQLLAHWCRTGAIVRSLDRQGFSGSSVLDPFLRWSTNQPRLCRRMLPPALESPPAVKRSHQWANAIRHDLAHKRREVAGHLIRPVATSCLLSDTGWRCFTPQLASSLTVVPPRFPQQPKILTSSFTKQA